MIKVIETPQRADCKISYLIDGDLITITIDEKSEVFDFSGFPEGSAAEITPEILPVLPIISAEKSGDEITLTVIRFYGADEKEKFENGENQMGL